ncbi:hypothetical protein O3P69_020421 [Scylla paramamosain]|uniref:Uncharacterized protein n=1 Tax=Scylla paramamosain TaxID=85552 RepID=A0AAW0TMD0_SCYPA
MVCAGLGRAGQGWARGRDPVYWSSELNLALSGWIEALRGPDDAAVLGGQAGVQGRRSEQASRGICRRRVWRRAPQSPPVDKWILISG